MVLAVFLLVYAGMFLGDLPRLRLGRTGIALLGAIALLVSREVSLEGAVDHIDLPTLSLLFGMMVLSAQLRLGGVYHAATRRIGRADASPSLLLALIIGLVGSLSAVFTNDIVALAVTPAVIELCRERRLNPVPFLLAVACAANVGSAATLIGNPQNILVGQALRLHFAGYTAHAVVPAALGLGAVWLVVRLVYRGRWLAADAGALAIGGRVGMPVADIQPGAARSFPEGVPFQRWQAVKGAVLAALVVLAFLFAPWPRELVALAAAGVVLSGRSFHSSEMLGLVDWPLLVLFTALFIVNGTLADSGLAAGALTALTTRGVDLSHPAWLFGISVTLSNVVSNVPAVMLLLPVAHGARAGAVLALSSTLAGNLLVVGSIANIIVVEQAAKGGIPIDWRVHARVGVPVTVLTSALAALALMFW